MHKQWFLQFLSKTWKFLTSHIVLKMYFMQFYRASLLVKNSPLPVWNRWGLNLQELSRSNTNRPWINIDPYIYWLSVLHWLVFLSFDQLTTVQPEGQTRVIIIQKLLLWPLGLLSNSCLSNLYQAKENFGLHEIRFLFVRTCWVNILLELRVNLSLALVQKGNQAISKAFGLKVAWLWYSVWKSVMGVGAIYSSWKLYT